MNIEAATPGLSFTPSKDTLASLCVDEIPVIILSLIIFDLFVIKVPCLFKKGVSKVSIIGVGMITTPGVTFRMFQALANEKINIQVISTSEIKISVLIDTKDVKKALNVLHKEFKLER